MVSEPDNSSLYRSSEGYRESIEHYDATLEGMGIPYASEYVETSFGITHAVVCGPEQAKTVVLWHGQNAHAASWASWIPALAAGYRVYAIDTIGSMGKSAATRPSKKGGEYGQWAAQAVRGLGIGKSGMIGVSEGGWLIVKLSALAPELIGSAILMSTAGFQRLNLVQALRTIPRVLGKPAEEAAGAMLEIVSAPGLPPDPFWLRLLELMIRHFRSESLVPVLPDEEINALTAPTYLLMGQYETAVNPHRVIDRGLRLLPNLIRAEIVPGVGHSMIHPEPDWVTTRVLQFLDRYST